MTTSSIDITDGIRQLYIPRLNNVAKIANVGLRMWLSKEDSFIPSYLGKDDTFELQFYDFSVFLSCVACDISRLSTASIESLFSIKESEVNRKSLAWELIKYYYSAFYAAHSTLKICNLGLIQLDSVIINNIIRRASTLGIPLSKISRGIYCFKTDAKNEKVFFFRLSKYDDSHRGVWKRYIDLFDILTGVSVETQNLGVNSIIKNTKAQSSQSIYSQMNLADAEKIVSVLDSLKCVLNKRGDANWLSSVRNDVNYNHHFGVWFPYKQYEESNMILPKMKGYFMLSPLDKKFNLDSSSTLLEFVNSCQLVNSINYSILSDLIKRHPANKSFVLNGPVSFVKLHARNLSDE